MAQSKAFADASHALNDLSHALALLESDNAKLRELVAMMYHDMQGVLDMSTDTVWVDDIGTLRDEMDCHMQVMAELGMPPADYERRMRELGVEVDG